MSGGFRMFQWGGPAITLVVNSAFAQTISNAARPELWVTDRDVHAMVESCGSLYIGGEFLYVGPYTGCFSGINAISGIAEPFTSKVDGGAVYAVAPDGDGGWYVGGSFTSVGGLAVNHLVHLRADRTIDTAWTPNPDGYVLALAYSGSTLYVGGAFNNIGGQSRNYIAAIDGTTGQATSWNPNSNGLVEALVVLGNTVYAGGQFSNMGGFPRNHLAKITGGVVTGWNPNANGTDVYAIAFSGGTVYVGGNFTMLGVTPRHRIAALNGVTGSPTAWNPGADDTVAALAIFGSTIYAGGSFTFIGGQNRNGIAAIDVGSGLATSWNPDAGIGSTVWALNVSGGAVYAGGSFDTIGTLTRRYLAAIDPVSGLATNWNPGANDVVYALDHSAGAVYAGGSMTSAGGVYRNRLAAIDTITGQATGWNPDANNTVRALAISGNTVYAGGYFTSVDGQARNGIAAIDAVTGQATSWDPGSNDLVDALAVSGDNVYAGGQFTSIGGQFRNRIAAVDANTALPTGWNPNADGPVMTLLDAGGIIYAGGGFTSIGGQTRNRIAALDASTGAATAWDPDANDVVWALATSGTDLYVGGLFTTIGGQSRSFIAAIDPSTGLATGWDPNAMGIDGVHALTTLGNVVIAGGYFQSIGGQTRNSLAAIDKTTGLATSWDPNPNVTLSVDALASSVDTVFAGGGFEIIGNEARVGLAGFGFVNSNWIGGPGFWNFAPNWNPPIVPFNTPCQQFNVDISNDALLRGIAVVTLDIDTVINSLHVEAGSTLNIIDGSLTIATGDGVINDGVVLVGPGRAIIAGVPMIIGGTQPVQLAGLNAAISSLLPVSTVMLATALTGWGLVDASFVNVSMIEANAAGQTLEIGGINSATSEGTLRASDFGTLLISRSVNGAGIYEAENGGEINIPGASAVNVLGASANISSGGRMLLSGQSHFGLIGDLTVGCGTFRGCTPPVLGLSGTSSTAVRGNFLCTGLDDISIGPANTFNLAGHFDNRCTSPATFHWESAPLTMDGAAGQTLEAAGDDLGPRDPDGFVDNFALGTLRLEPGVIVDVINNFDNVGIPGCEVLYVDTLSLGVGATFRLNGCNVYYNTLIQEAGAMVTTLSGALLMSTDAGDLDGDNDMDEDDVNQFVNVLLGGSCSPPCLVLADVNGDGLINGADIALFTRILLGWP